MLKRSLEEFLKIEQLKKEEAMQNRLLINAYYEKCDYDEIEKMIVDCVADREKQSIRDANYYQEMLWLQEELYYHPNQGKYLNNQQYFPFMVHYLDQFYALSKLRFATEMNVRKGVVNEDDLPLLDESIVTKQLKRLAANNRLIDLYYYLFQFQLEIPSSEEFRSSIALLTELLPQMGEKEKSYILSCLISTAIRYHHKGKSEYTAFVAQLYKLADEKNLLLYRGKMQATTFLNIAILCSAAKEFAFVENIISRYQQYLAPEEKQEVIHLSWGYWYYLQSGNHPKKKTMLQKAQYHLSQIPYSGLVVDLRLRSLQLRVFYDLEISNGNESVFSHFADAFEKWLVRNPILANQRTAAYLNFVRLTKQLGKIAILAIIDKDDLQQLEKKISTQEPLILRNWLLEKVEELQ